jgi:hypothetical protein
VKSQKARWSNAQLEIFVGRTVLNAKCVLPIRDPQAALVEKDEMNDVEYDGDIMNAPINAKLVVATLFQAILVCTLYFAIGDGPCTSCYSSNYVLGCPCFFADALSFFVCCHLPSCILTLLTGFLLRACFSGVGAAGVGWYRRFGHGLSPAFHFVPEVVSFSACAYYVPSQLVVYLSLAVDCNWPPVTRSHNCSARRQRKPPCVCSGSTSGVFVCAFQRNRSSRCLPMLLTPI